MNAHSISTTQKLEKDFVEKLTSSPREKQTPSFSEILDEQSKPKAKKDSNEKNNSEEEKGEAKEKQEDPKPAVATKLQEVERELSPLQRFLYELSYRDPDTWSLADRQFYRIDQANERRVQNRRLAAEVNLALATLPQKQLKGGSAQEHGSRLNSSSRENMAGQEQSSVFLNSPAHFRSSLKEIEERHGIKESQILEQVLDKLSIRQIRDGSEVNIELNPQALGKVRLQLTVQGHEVSAKFQTQNRRVGQILKDHLKELSQSLSKQGLLVKTLEVEKIN